VQIEEPLSEEYLPAAQLTHWVPPVVFLKVPKVQLAHALAPVADEAPAGQLVQPVPPETEENVPVAHVEQKRAPGVAE